MTWYQGRMLAFDTETTAADPDHARIVSACIAAVGGGLDPWIRTWLINPGVEIPAEANAVHGITTEQAQATGSDPSISVPELHHAIQEAWRVGWPVVAFNASYDLTVLDRELRRHTGAGLGQVGPVIDPYVIDRAIDKYRRGSRTLSAMAEHYAVRLDGAHDAAEDALAAARVAWRIATRHPHIGTASLEQLQQMQAAWHRERQADFAAYLRRQGKPADDVDGQWPLRAMVMEPA